MNLALFLVKCYTIGVIAASGIGPIFVLTFNRAALYGFTRGFATALGASIADAIFFFLALMGVLTIIQDFRHVALMLDFLAGAVLLFLAIKSFRNIHVIAKTSVGSKESFPLTVIHSFGLTVINPMTVFFFMLMSTKLLPSEALVISWHEGVIGSILVMIGSCSTLSSIALIASLIRHRLEYTTLRAISYLSGAFFCGYGLYLLGLFFVKLFRL